MITPEERTYLEKFAKEAKKRNYPVTNEVLKRELAYYREKQSTFDYEGIAKLSPDEFKKLPWKTKSQFFKQGIEKEKQAPTTAIATAPATEKPLPGVTPKEVGRAQGALILKQYAEELRDLPQDKLGDHLNTFVDAMIEKSPLGIADRIMDIMPKYHRVEKQVGEEKHPAAKISGDMAGRVLTLLTTKQLGAIAGSAVAAKTAPFSLINPFILSRIIPSIAAGGTTWGLAELLEETAKQKEEGEFKPERMAGRVAAETLFGGLWGGALSIPQPLGRITAAGAVRGIWTTAETLIKKHKIEKEDLLNIALNTGISALLASIGAKSAQKRWDETNMINRSKREILAKLKDNIERQLMGGREAQMTKTITPEMREIADKAANETLRLLNQFEMYSTPSAYTEVLKSVPESFTRAPAHIQTRWVERLTSEIRLGKPIMEAIELATQEFVKIMPRIDVTKALKSEPQAQAEDIKIPKSTSLIKIRKLPFREWVKRVMSEDDPLYEILTGKAIREPRQMIEEYMPLKKARLFTKDPTVESLDEVADRLGMSEDDLRMQIIQYLDDYALEGNDIYVGAHRITQMERKIAMEYFKALKILREKRKKGLELTEYLNEYEAVEKKYDKLRAGISSLAKEMGFEDAESMAEEILDNAYDQYGYVFSKKRYQKDIGDLMAKNMSMVALDGIDFGRFNKKFGQNFGDDILAMTSKVIKEFADEHGGLAYRFGGDEYEIFFDDIIDDDILSSLNERLRDATQKYFGDKIKKGDEPQLRWIQGKPSQGETPGQWEDRLTGVYEGKKMSERFERGETIVEPPEPITEDYSSEDEYNPFISEPTQKYEAGEKPEEGEEGEAGATAKRPPPIPTEPGVGGEAIGELPLNPDGTVTLYHRTNTPIEEIRKTGFRSMENTDEIYFSTKKTGQAEGYGEKIIEIKVDPADVRIDDQFPSGEIHVAIKRDQANKYLQTAGEALKLEGQEVRAAKRPPPKQSKIPGTEKMQFPTEPIKPETPEEKAKASRAESESKPLFESQGVKGAEQLRLGGQQKRAAPQPGLFGSDKVKDVVDKHYNAKEPEIREQQQSGKLTIPRGKLGIDLSGIRKFASGFKREISKYTYYPQFKKYPQLRNDVRKLYGRLGEVHDNVGKIMTAIFGGLSRDQVEKAEAVIYWRDRVARINKDMIDNIELADAEKALTEAVSNADVKAIGAANAYKEISNAFLENLIERGELPEGSGFSDYMPHYVEKYDYPWRTSAGIPTRAAHKSWRGYTKKVAGTKKEYSKDVARNISRHFYDVLANNMWDDFLHAELEKYDITSRIHPSMRAEAFGRDKSGKPLTQATPGKIQTINGEDYEGYQFEKGRILFPVHVGENQERTVRALGRYKKTYFIPKDMADGFKQFNPTISFPGLYYVNRFTNWWKSMAILFSFPKFNINNMVGDGYMTYLQYPKAFMQVPNAVRQLTRKPSQYNAKQQELANFLADQDVVQAGFISSELEPHYNIGFGTILRKSQDISQWRESVLRISIAQQLLNDYKKKGRAVIDQFDWVDTKGLEDMDALGKIARDLLIDYGSTSKTFNRVLKAGGMPWATFYLKATQQSAKYAAKHPFPFLLKTVIPIAAMTLYNYGRHRETEENLPDYVRNRTHLILKGDSGNGKSLVWMPQIPIDILFGFPLFNISARYAADAAHGRLSWREAGKRTLKEWAGENARLFEYLQNPIVNFLRGVASNRNQFGGKIVPMGGDVPLKHKLHYWSLYATETLLPPIALAQRAEKRAFEMYADVPGSGMVRSVGKWALEWFHPLRMLGVYEVDLTGKEREIRNTIHDAEVVRNGIIVDFSNEFVKGRDLGMLIEKYTQLAHKKGLVFEGTEFDPILDNKYWLTERIEYQLRTERDPDKRKALEEQRRLLRSAKFWEQIEKIPEYMQPKVYERLQQLTTGG